MSIRERDIDLGPCRGVLHEGDAARCAVLLPGASYPTRAPLLWFAGEVAGAHGWSVLEVRDEWGGAGDALEWARDRTRRALDAVAGARTLLIGKSLSSASATIAADRALPAVWLTPLLDEDEVVTALGRASQPTLLVGSAADPYWNGGAVPATPTLEVLDLPDLDHGFVSRHGPAESVKALGLVTATLDAFIARLDR